MRIGHLGMSLLYTKNGNGRKAYSNRNLSDCLRPCSINHSGFCILGKFDFSLVLEASQGGSKNLPKAWKLR